MSQKKIDAYKKEKANRAQIIKKEKRILMLEKIAGLLVCLVAVGWIGFSVYGKVTDKGATAATAKETVMDTSALDDYVAGLSDAEAETADAE